MRMLLGVPLEDSIQIGTILRQGGGARHRTLPGNVTGIMSRTR